MHIEILYTVSVNFKKLLIKVASLPKSKELSSEKRAQIKVLHEQGLTQRVITSSVIVSQPVVAKNYQESLH